ncbi:MAG: NAD-dependent protein deacetylase [Gammaproteobacteria bacterium]
MKQSTETIAELADILRARKHIAAITGAGISTDSGIPDYRDADGNWKRCAPVMFRDFVENLAVRRRYWARSMSGWPSFEAARPAAAHHALSTLEAAGRLQGIVTQNVDDLHRRAGSRHVVDLHGRLARVRCLDCGQRSPRALLQQELLRSNPGFQIRLAGLAPDGDADLEQTDYSTFVVPTCPKCGGLLKPDVTFYGETIPPERTRRAEAILAGADAVLVIGSSLMVFSAYRLVRNAARAGIPVFALNLGRTRADDLLEARITAPAGETVPTLAAALTL